MADPAEGIPIQSLADLKKLPVDVLIEKIRLANVALQDEKRQSMRKEAEANARLKLECDRLRAATSQHNRELEEQNSTLLKSLTRLQGDLDKTKQENTTLQVKLEIYQSTRGHAEERLPAAHALAQAPDQTHLGTTPLALTSTPTLSGEAVPPKLPQNPQAAPLPAQAQAIGQQS